MNFTVIGINHKTAPIQIREKFFLDSTQQELFLSELRNNPKIYEAFVLSTCNRTEVYLHSIDEEPLVEEIIDLLGHIKKVEAIKSYRKYFYICRGNDTVEHLLRVSSGLDSLILGEKQILGQVKTAFKRAQEMTMLGKSFNVLSNIALRTGKKARTETDISVGGSSVSWAAVILVEQILGSLRNKKILIIGAGKMSELAIQQVCKKKGKGELYLMNRTGEKAEKLAKRVKGIAVAFYDIKEILSKVDICICSVGAPHYIIDDAAMKDVMKNRKNKKLIIVDISMPRNVDPKVAEISGVSLLMIDDMDQFIDANMKKRQNAVKKVNVIIQDKIVEFNKKLEKLADRRPTINLPV